MLEAPSSQLLLFFLSSSDCLDQEEPPSASISNQIYGEWSAESWLKRLHSSSLDVGEKINKMSKTSVAFCNQPLGSKKSVNRTKSKDFSVAKLIIEIAF